MKLSLRHVKNIAFGREQHAGVERSLDGDLEDLGWDPASAAYCGTFYSSHLTSFWGLVFSSVK